MMLDPDLCDPSLSDQCMINNTAEFPPDSRYLSEQGPIEKAAWKDWVFLF